MMNEYTEWAPTDNMTCWGQVTGTGSTRRLKALSKVRAATHRSVGYSMHKGGQRELLLPSWGKGYLKIFIFLFL